MNGTPEWLRYRLHCARVAMLAGRLFGGAVYRLLLAVERVMGDRSLHH